jgi:hypothetical protein
MLVAVYDLRHLDLDTTMRCPKCDAEWQVFAGRESSLTSRDWQSRSFTTKEAGSVTAVTSQPTAVPVSDQLEFVEVEVSGDVYRETDRLFDNRLGSTSATQRLAITEQWTQAVQVDRELARVVGGSLRIGVFLGELQAKAERTLRTQYSVSETGQRTYTDELTVEVPAHTLRRLHVTYRRIWQTGVLRTAMSDGTTLEVPYRVAIALEMDWSQHDSASAEVD